MRRTLLTRITALDLVVTVADAPAKRVLDSWEKMARLNAETRPGLDVCQFRDTFKFCRGCNLITGLLAFDRHECVNSDAVEGGEVVIEDDE